MIKCANASSINTHVGVSNAVTALAFFAFFADFLGDHGWELGKLQENQSYMFVLLH